jgi:hypothetical protein
MSTISSSNPTEQSMLLSIQYVSSYRTPRKQTSRRCSISNCLYHGASGSLHPETPNIKHDSPSLLSTHIVIQGTTRESIDAFNVEHLCEASRNGNRRLPTIQRGYKPTPDATIYEKHQQIIDTQLNSTLIAIETFSTIFCEDEEPQP